MAHLFNQIYANNVEFVDIGHDDLISLLYVEFLSKKIQELRRAEEDASVFEPWTDFQNCLEMLTEEDRWFNFANRAVNAINREHFWNGICEAFKFLKYSGPTSSQKIYYEKLWKAPWNELMSIYTQTIRPPFFVNLFDYVDCACKLKYRTSV